MIKIRIKNADHEIDIRFPISESELFAKLGEIHAVEGRDAAQSALVTDVYWPEEFSMLKDRFANLDEWCCHDRVPLVPRWAIHRWDCDNPCAVLPADQPHQRIRSRASQAPLTTE